MARMRAIKPGFFTNDALAEIEPLGRLLFAGLWTIADRQGRLEDRPRKIKAELLPYDDCDADALLDALAARGFIVRYRVDGTRLIQVCNWDKHQQPHVNERESDWPAPVAEPEQHPTSTVQAPEINGASTMLVPEGVSTEGAENWRDYAENTEHGTSTVQAPEQHGTNTPLTEQNRTVLEPEPELEDIGAADAAASAPPDPVDWVWEFYKSEIQPEARVCPRDKIRTRLKRFTPDELTIGIQNFRDDAWCMDHNRTRGGGWFFESDARSEHFLTMEPRAAPAQHGAWSNHG